MKCEIYGCTGAAKWEYGYIETKVCTDCRNELAARVEQELPCERL